MGKCVMDFGQLPLLAAYWPSWLKVLTDNWTVCSVVMGHMLWLPLQKPFIQY